MTSKRQTGRVRWAVALSAAACAFLTGTALAQPASYLDQAVEALQIEPVYVHPEASETLSRGDAARIEDAIAGAGAGAIYVAVLPEEARNEAGGSTEQLLQDIHSSLGRDGTFIVITGNELRAGSTEFPEGVVPDIATEAINEGDDAADIVLIMVERLKQTAAGQPVESEEEDEGSGFGFALLPILVVGGLLLFAFSAYRKRRRQQEEERRQLAEVREVALDDLVSLGNDLRAIEIDIEMPDANPAAKSDYTRALDLYQQASTDLDNAQRLDDLSRVTSTLEEGRYALASAQARLEGREPPERRPPCFFDPRHGPSVTDVQWAPPNGAPRDVPACASDAQRVAAGEEPMSRQIMVEGAMTPFWNAPYYYGPWYGGYYGGFGGGLLPGLLIGSMLGGGMGFGYGGFGMGGFGYGGWGDQGYGGDAGSGGDFGGGDFGGGDFGGGDFGGGDFGGGDFGGGDF